MLNKASYRRAIRSTQSPFLGLQLPPKLPWVVTTRPPCQGLSSFPSPISPPSAWEERLPVGVGVEIAEAIFGFGF